MAGYRRQAMEISVSLTAGKNLSHSSLILRNLQSTLQIGSRTHTSQQLEADGVPFTASTDEKLVVKLSNSQTSTVMFLRNVPLRLLAGPMREVSLWIAVYPPGDARNDTFEETSPPRPEVPQVNLSVRILQRDVADNSDAPSAANSAANGAGDHRSNIEHTTRLDEKARQAEAIKQKVSSMASAKSKVHSTQQQIAEVDEEIDRMRSMIKQAESELTQVAAGKLELERDRAEAEESLANRKEVLRLRDLSIQELRATRDEADRQLSQVIEDRHEKRSSMDSSMKNFNEEVKGMASELEQHRVEASGLSEALKRCDKRVAELQERTAAGGGGAELKALQQQLGQAMEELERVKHQGADQVIGLAQAEEECLSAKGRLKDSEAKAEETRKRLANIAQQAEVGNQRAISLRAESEAAEKELLAQARRAAQLDGQVSENKNQIKEMKARIKEVEEHVNMNEGIRDNLSCTVNQLQDTLRVQASEGETFESANAELQAKLQRVMQEAERCRRKAAEHEASQREAEEATGRKKVELDATQRVLDSVLHQAVGEEKRLQDDAERLRTQVTGAEAEAEARVQAFTETEQRAQDVNNELELLALERIRRAREREEAERLLASLEPEVEKARAEAREADEEAARLRGHAQVSEAERARSQMELEAQVATLDAQMAELCREAQEAEEQRKRVYASLEESQALRPMQEARKHDLQSAQEALQQEVARLRAASQEAKEGAAQKQADIGRLREELKRHRDSQTEAADSEASNEQRRAELRRALDDSRADFGQKAQAAQSELQEVEGAGARALAEIQALRASRDELAATMTSMQERFSQASEDLERHRAELSSGERDAEGQIMSLEADLVARLSEEAELNGQILEIEAELAEAERSVAAEEEQGSALEATLRTQQAKRYDVTQARDRHAADYDEAVARRASASASVDALKEQAVRVEGDVGSLRSMLEQAQADVDKARALRSEIEGIASQRQEFTDHFSQTMSLKESELMDKQAAAIALGYEGQHPDLEQSVAKIGTLQSEVLSLTAKVSAYSSTQGTLAEKLQDAAGSESETKSGVTEQLKRVAALEQELKSFEDWREQLTGKIAAAEGRLQTAEAAVEKHQQIVNERDAELAAGRARLESTTRGTEEMKVLQRKALSELQVQRKEAEAMAAQLLGELCNAQDHLEGVNTRMSGAREKEVSLGSELQMAEAELQAITTEYRAAVEEATNYAVALKEAALEDDAGGGARPATGDVSAQVEANEQKVRLLKSQMEQLQEAQKNAEVEVLKVDELKDELARESSLLRQEMSMISDKLAHQVEHSDIQCSVVEQLEEDIRRSEMETEDLTLLLHESDTENQVLQKEHVLLELLNAGQYQGTLQEWAAEMISIRRAGDEEKEEDELSHWRKKAEEDQRETASAMEAMRQQHDQAEAPLKQQMSLLNVDLAETQRRLMEDKEEDILGSVHSVPAPLHGLVEPARPLPANTAKRRRALIVGVNYSKSHNPLEGCTNDAWNVQCLLRHSLRYAEDQVLSLIDGSDHCPTPPSRQPTRANILSGLRWLTANAQPGDNIAFFYSGYGTQQPSAGTQGLYQKYFVPTDFAGDLPKDFFNPGYQAPTGVLPASYRLVPLTELVAAMGRLPAGCKATLVIDCCHGVLPNVDSRSPVPPAAQPTVLELDPTDVMHASERPIWRPRILELPPLPSPPGPALSTVLAANCFCYSACLQEQWCAELPIEGCVQGAFTWAFVKALTAGHLDSTAHQHLNSLRTILGNLSRHFRWIQQVPVLQLSGAAVMTDTVLVPS